LNPRELLDLRMERWSAASWAELSELERAEGVDERVGGYRLRSYAFWDMEPWQSGLYVKVKIYGRGLRRLWPYSGVIVRGSSPEDGDPLPDEPQRP
jgi:hypothetical protein